MNEREKQELDTFQLKGLRKMLGIRTTYIDKTQDSKKYTNKYNNTYANIQK